ncbi:c-type cytochrome [Robertkochia solimangrovi]|uniref:c-type cytochrome n=1 Tax=Robertkochia solimangrovi TaxID=2213046 RepID=UPI0013A5372D|nr:c-type cytochrome [Robertkochia solimangrovi]
MGKKKLRKQFRDLRGLIKRYCCFLAIAVVILLVIYYELFPRFGMGIASEYSDPLNIYRDIAMLDSTAENEMILYGYDLFQKTPAYIGKRSRDTLMHFAGNTLSCGNCHLFAGTKPYAAPMIGVLDRYPQYRGREDQIGTIEDRINGCMERSMNGRLMEKGSREMLAFVAYFRWLDKYKIDGEPPEGTGYLNVQLPERAVDTVKGKELFDRHCSVCHQPDGSGVVKKDSTGFLYPPLWGVDTYNNGAGMTRVITAAEFIKANMPFGTSYNAPYLTDEECYDVAGYINVQLRPVKTNLEADFPDLKKKPVSTPYPPFADPFDVTQHQLGPFQPIMEYYQKEYGMKKSK